MKQKVTDGTIGEAVSEMLTKRFAPPTVIVDNQGEIIHIHGRTGRFLELAPGGPTNNIVKLARKGLEIALASSLRQAARELNPVIHENIQVKTNGAMELVTLSVQRLTEPETLKGLLRVSFEVVPQKQADSTDKKSPTKESKSGSIREQELENELQQSRESLQHTIEELDASNEEMKSTNEELQSTNEELQSTNEELETSKEELHSLNEELQTVNAEFQDKIQQHRYRNHLFGQSAIYQTIHGAGQTRHSADPHRRRKTTH
jgi:two-component system CheB/CheR fusion protein